MNFNLIVSSKIMEEGDTFPEFSLQSHLGNEINSKDLKGKKFAIFAYPRAMTSGCTKEVCSIRDGYQDLKALGIIPFGISNDPVVKNKKFAEKHNIQYELLSDPDNTLLTELGIYGEKKMYGKTYMGTKRFTFVVDEEFKIIRIIKKVNTADHANQIIELLNN